MQLHVKKIISQIPVTANTQLEAVKRNSAGKRSPETNTVRGWPRETSEYRRQSERHAQLRDFGEKVYKLCGSNLFTITKIIIANKDIYT